MITVRMLERGLNEFRKRQDRERWHREVMAFIRANRDAPLPVAEYRKIVRLRLGASVKVGGGAGAEMTVTRTRKNALEVS